MFPSRKELDSSGDAKIIEDVIWMSLFLRDDEWQPEMKPLIFGNDKKAYWWKNNAAVKNAFLMLKIKN